MVQLWNSQTWVIINFCPFSCFMFLKMSMFLNEVSSNVNVKVDMKSPVHDTEPRLFTSGAGLGSSCLWSKFFIKWAICLYQLCTKPFLCVPLTLDGIWICQHYGSIWAKEPTDAWPEKMSLWMVTAEKINWMNSHGQIRRTCGLWLHFCFF